MTTIKCANIYGHGMETLAEVIANSCNDAMMQIGAKMGVENFLKHRVLSISEAGQESIFQMRIWYYAYC